MSTPLYLAAPEQDGRTHGSVRYDPKRDSWMVAAEPMVLELAKRLFPGCTAAGYANIDDKCKTVRFPATVRATGDLNWLMLRYPLHVENPEEFAAAREKAIAHALRREANGQAGPVVVPPTFVGKLKPYQDEGVSFLVTNARTLLADDMGLGKTVQTLAALAAADAFPALLVVPTNVQRQWQIMAGTFLNLQVGQLDMLGLLEQGLSAEERGRRMCHIMRGLKPYDLPQKPLVICHYGLLRGWREVLPDWGFRAVVFDEIQELRHHQTEKYSVASLVSGAVSYAWGLSGTPIYNKGGEIWAVLNALEFHCLGDRESFTREWCNGYGSDVVDKPEVLGDYLRREGLMLRREKAAVQSQLPPKRRVVVAVDSDHDVYSRMIGEAVRLAKGYAALTEWRERGQAVRQIEGFARQAAGAAKAPYVATFVEQLLEAGERVLLFAYHHEVHDTLTDRLRHFFPVRITGKETPAEKQHAIQRFAEGKTNLVQLSLRSTAGLDGLQGRATCVVFAELDWSPAVHSQCEDRLHRVGMDESLESILCYYLVSDTGSDAVMQDALGLKIGQFTALMGARSETEDDKLLAGQAAEAHLRRLIERLRGDVRAPGEMAAD